MVFRGTRMLMVAGISVCILFPGRKQGAIYKDMDIREALLPGDHAFAIKVGVSKRTFLVHVPTKYNGSQAIPLVFCYHGAGGSGEGTSRLYGWIPKADQENFIVVFPDGLPARPLEPAQFRSNPRLWNDGSGRGVIGRLNTDDVGFARAMRDDLTSRYRIDPRRIYVTGFSNGAGLTFRLGVELSDSIAAIAPVASYLWLKEPHLKRPVPLIYFIGTEDPLVPPKGGFARTPWSSQSEKKPPVQESIDTWVALNHCPPVPHVIFDQNGVKALRYGPGKENSEVLYYTIEGMGHNWPGGSAPLPENVAGKASDKIKATDVIWKFFQKHTLQKASP